MPIQSLGLSYFVNGEITLDGCGRAPSDQISFGGSPFPSSNDYVFGDVATLTGHAHGGNDSVLVHALIITLVGDARTIDRFAHGGDDLLRVSGGVGGEIIGDALEILGHGAGGNDLINLLVRGGSAYGDAHTLGDFARGGDDDITISGRFVNAWGDAGELTEHATGGNDILRGGGDTTTVLIGDGTLSGHAHGGDDILYAPGFGLSVTLMGDGTLRDHAVAGDDILVAAPAGASLMLWGDGPIEGQHVHTGDDRFVLHPGHGHVTIMDFQHADDVIDMTAMASAGIHGLSDLQVSQTTTDAGADIEINGAGLTLLVHANAKLTAHDFLFA